MSHTERVPLQRVSLQDEHKSALRKHADFFDKDRDGWLSLTDTWTSFRSLGYGYILSAFAVFVIHFTLSYPTQDSWVPPLDRFWMVNLKNIHRCKHGSDTETYTPSGEFDQAKFDRIWKKFDPEDTGRLNRTQIIKMICDNRNIYDIFGVIGQIMEWGLLYLLVADHGAISKEMVKSQYDGTLFWEIEKKKNQKKP